MAARRIAVKAVDWTRLGATIPKAASADFNAFRTRHDSVKGELNALAEKPTPINWDHYLVAVKNTALVEKFQAAYSQVTVPYPEDTESAKIALEEKELEVEIAAAMVQKKERIATLVSDIAAIKAERPFEEITTNEHMAEHPHLKAENDADVKAIGWSS